MKINAGVNVKNLLIKTVAINGLLGIVAIVNMNVIDHMILENIQIMKTVNIEENWLMNWLKNLLKILMQLKWQE